MSSNANVPQKVKDVHEIFKNFFGDDYVDLQSDDHSSDDRWFIYVWFPEVTVTNEHDKSITIQDLYAQIEINEEGFIPFEFPGFMLNRATYTKEQFLSNYLHSHINGIPKDDLSEFMTPCLGNGPIGRTVQTLKTDYDEAEWMLFCQELSMYVTVESLKGGPWRRLESVGTLYILSSYNNGFDFSSAELNNFFMVFDMSTLRSFFKYYLEHGHLSITYKDCKFCCGMSYYDYIIDVSNAFIAFYNLYLKTTEEHVQTLFNANILRHVLVSNCKFYKPALNGNQDISPYIGNYVLTFKGKEIHSSIIDSPSPETVPTTVINHRLAMYILKQILRTINFKYKNEHSNNTAGQQESAQTNRRVFYL